jgi:four helix bundle protein
MKNLYIYPSNNTFEKIKAWQLGRTFRKELYDITKDFPKDEKFGIISQIRRCAISITANIAEGYGRYHFQETIQFARQSRGSVSEIIDYMYTAFDESYINKETFKKLYAKARVLERAINGYITFLRSQRSKNK